MSLLIDSMCKYIIPIVYLFSNLVHDSHVLSHVQIFVILILKKFFFFLKVDDGGLFFKLAAFVIFFYTVTRINDDRIFGKCK